MLTTFYSIQLKVSGEIAEWQYEGRIPTTEREVLDAIADLSHSERVVRIIRVDYDVPPRDVTEDIWHLAEMEWSATHTADSDDLPLFIADHAPIDYYTGYRG